MCGFAGGDAPTVALTHGLIAEMAERIAFAKNEYRMFIFRGSGPDC